MGISRAASFHLSGRHPRGTHLLSAPFICLPGRDFQPYPGHRGQAPGPEKKERDPHPHPSPEVTATGSPPPLSPLSGSFPSEEGARRSSLVAGSDAAALSQAAPRRQRRRRRCSLARPVAVTARRRLRRLRFPDRPGARQPPQLAGRSHRFCSCRRRRRRHHGARGCSPAGGLGALSPLVAASCRRLCRRHPPPPFSPPFWAAGKEPRAREPEREAGPGF